jgi:hypothetical protein
VPVDGEVASASWASNDAICQHFAAQAVSTRRSSIFAIVVS